MNPQNDTSTTAGKIADLQDRLAKSRQPAGEDAVRAVHNAGRLTARERVEALLDDGSFVEIDALARHRSKVFDLEKERPLTDGVVTGHGTIDGRPVCVFSQDATLFEGKIGETTGAKIIKVLELALKSGTPVIGFYDGAGARLKEGIIALDMYSRILRLQTQASGVIPQIAVVAGECRVRRRHLHRRAGFPVYGRQPRRGGRGSGDRHRPHRGSRRVRRTGHGGRRAELPALQ